MTNIAVLFNTETFLKNTCGQSRAGAGDTQQSDPRTNSKMQDVVSKYDVMQALDYLDLQEGFALSLFGGHWTVRTANPNIEVVHEQYQVAIVLCYKVHQDISVLKDLRSTNG